MIVVTKAAVPAIGSTFSYSFLVIDDDVTESEVTFRYRGVVSEPLFIPFLLADMPSCQKMSAIHAQHYTTRAYLSCHIS